ncbi:hypothetical protein K450DRAFT_240210 [Umbelopsis ramanniana AG]|uniref:Uncharacterized protein n=1 Tax=Umbelopsis ramanniana AG TaxID=1314678 RepID=A0AAD5EA90_UMBRA|nr:uncharacterized protein K450DRAFT_240210 [Umbelopsis ramanniana AG]KAI8579759.1 hypothetical protein K450DRAFT_240210 [Umbelopsis ramanniana AG]
MGIIRTSIAATTLFCFLIDLVFLRTSANQAIKDCVSGTFGGILQVLVGQVRKDLECSLCLPFYG